MSDFTLNKINTAPEGSNLKAWEVRIQLQNFCRDENKIFIGADCRSQEELDEQINYLVKGLKALRFPKG